MTVKDCIFFDLDGTLTDPGPGITNSIAFALKKQGLPVPEREQLYSFIGPPLVPSFIERFGMDEACAKQTLMYYREYFAEKGIFENRLYDGIPELLHELKTAGKRLCLATSKPDVYSLRIIKHFGISDFFDGAAANNMEETRSDKHAVIEYGMELMGIDDPGRAVMVGDRCHDIIGAKKSGLSSVGVLYGYGSIAELTDAGADHIVKDTAELKALLLSL